MKLPFPITLALDLEGTLISNAVSQMPRPGLHWFLDFARHFFERVVIFTTVSESLFREIAGRLTEEGLAPAWFASIDYVTWDGHIKDLAFADGAERTLLVDDYVGYIHALQHHAWIQAPQFAWPYADEDHGLRDVSLALLDRIYDRPDITPQQTRSNKIEVMSYLEANPPPWPAP
jgi:hypothetical protein